jgi:hypothetical protein
MLSELGEKIGSCFDVFLSVLCHMGRMVLHPKSQEKKLFTVCDPLETNRGEKQKTFENH